MDNKEMQDAVRIVDTIKQFKLEPKNALDIGSSRGYLMIKMASEFNCKVDGIEPNLAYNQTSGDVFVDLKYAPSGYDMITMIHTLEHVPYPVEFLKDAVSKLDDNGVAVIEVPSQHSPGGPMREAHLFYFQPWTLHKVCWKAGLKLETMLNTPHLLVIGRKK